MKKIVYVVVVLLILLGIAVLLRSNQPTPVVSEPEPAVVEDVVVTEDTVAADVAAEEVVVVEEEPAENVSEETVEVVEENPEQTSDEDETVIEE